jgi:NAD(P)-dependent dehydrogenase (short-subunit alcohol dehydrogenase family)
LAEFSQINGLLNNAAGIFISPTKRLSHRAIDTIVDIALKGTNYTTLALGKHWIEQKQAATVLSIVTTYASTGSGFLVPLSMAKSGVLTMTQVWPLNGQHTEFDSMPLHLAHFQSEVLGIDYFRLKLFLHICENASLIM